MIPKLSFCTTKIGTTVASIVVSLTVFFFLFSSFPKELSSVDDLEAGLHTTSNTSAELIGSWRGETGQIPVSTKSQTAYTIPLSRRPKHELVTSYCGDVKSRQLHDLASQLIVSPDDDPMFLHFKDGEHLENIHRPAEFDVGAAFCTVYLIPQHLQNATNSTPIAAKDGWGPDSIHAEMSSDDVRIMLPSPDFWGFLTIRGVQHNERVHVAVYMNGFRLDHPGNYKLTGEVEFSDNTWVMEDDVDLTVEPLPYNMTELHILPRSPAIDIKGKPASRPHARCYQNGHNNLQGRWYRASSFSKTGSQTQLNPESRLTFADHANVIDRWGWTFAPDECSLQYYSAGRIKALLENQTVQVLGDSNSRRFLKSLISGGEMWCMDHDERWCNCEDHFVHELQDMDGRDMNASYFADVEARANPITFGSNTKAYFDFIGGLVNQKLFNGWEFFYDGGPGFPSIVSKRQVDNGDIDIVHVSVIGWDVAAVRSIETWVASFEHFRKKLLAAYPAGTKFVHRLANNMCCGNVNHRARYSAPRFRLWNEVYRSWWSNDELNGVHKVVDVTALQGRRDAETQFYCPTTHMRASHVRLEMMIWLNAVFG